MSFLNPFLLIGLAAAAIPIAVHLFNFRKPQRVDFSTLRFLRALEATTMRRMRIRQWLLLALRIGAIAFAVLAFAQPISSAVASGVFGDNVARSVAVVFDNSLSTTLRNADGALIDQARAVADAVVASTGTGDERTIVPTAAPPDYRPVPFATPGPAQDVIAGLGALSGAESLTSAIARGAAVLEGAAHPRKEIVVVTDLQASTFTDSSFASLPEDVELTLLPIGSRAGTNTAVTGARVVSRIIEPGRPVEIEATVVRYGGRAGTVAASLSFDGKRVSEASVELTPAVPAKVTFTTTPTARGWLGGEIRIEPDDAEWDDVRYIAVNVPPAPRVLVVRGEGARADLVTLALGVAAERGGLVINEVAEGALGTAGMDGYDAVVLVGPSDAGRAAAASLSSFVASGKGVLVFPGDDALAANGLLAAVGGGRITDTIGRVDGPSLGGISESDTDHPLFAGVFDSSTPRLENPDVRKAIRYVPGGGDEQTLLQLQAGAPLVQEIRYGDGRVLLFGVAPDLNWSDLPSRGLFVPLLFRAATYLSAGSAAAEDGDLRVRTAGSLRVEGAEPGTALRLVAPDGTSIAPTQRIVPGAVLIDIDGAISTPGIYKVMQGERLLRTVAINEDPRESDPTRLDAQEAAKRLEVATGRPVRVRDAASAGAGEAGGASGPAWWTIFLGLALACMLAETLVATLGRSAKAGAADVAKR